MKGPGRGVADVDMDEISLRVAQEAARNVQTTRRPDDETWPISRFGPNLRRSVGTYLGACAASVSRSTLTLTFILWCKVPSTV